MKTGILLLAVFLGVTACAPAVGSEKWCDHMKKKDKSDWTLNEAGDFAKHCVMKGAS